MISTIFFAFTPQNHINTLNGNNISKTTAKNSNKNVFITEL